MMTASSTTSSKTETFLVAESGRVSMILTYDIAFFGNIVFIMSFVFFRVVNTFTIRLGVLRFVVDTTTVNCLVHFVRYNNVLGRTLRLVAFFIEIVVTSFPESIIFAILDVAILF